MFSGVVQKQFLLNHKPETEHSCLGFSGSRGAPEHTHTHHWPLRAGTRGQMTLALYLHFCRPVREYANSDSCAANQNRDTQ